MRRLHNRDAVAQLERLVEVMATKMIVRSARAEAPGNSSCKMRADQRIDRGERLVHQQDRRIGRQKAARQVRLRACIPARDIPPLRASAPNRVKPTSAVAQTTLLSAGYLWPFARKSLGPTNISPTDRHAAARLLEPHSHTGLANMGRKSLGVGVGHINQPVPHH